MDIIAALIRFDEWLFLSINGLYHRDWLDSLFLFFSFYPLFIWMLIGIIVTLVEERRDHTFIVKLLLGLGLAGMFASVYLKPVFGRPRPDISHGVQVVLVPEKAALVPANNDFAFPSGHAAVAFAGAYILTREETRKAHKLHTNQYRKMIPWIFYFLAAVTALSRIYLGKHYPLDVLVGAILGMLTGKITWEVIEFLKVKLLKNFRLSR